MKSVPFVPSRTFATGITIEKAISREQKFSAQTYHPLPVVWNRAKGCNVWDVEGNEYLDFLAAYSAVNQGHGHPKILGAMVEQAKQLELSSRAFYSDKFGEFAEYATKYFGYDRILPMNTGAEAVETSMKIARKWAYDVKGVEPNQAVILVAKENFHGRTISIISMSNDPVAQGGFGPYTPGFEHVEYGDYADFERVMNGPLKNRIAAFLVEPIQGEAGVKIPKEGYLRQARKLCKDNNVLFIADEIQSGLGRPGQMLAYCWDCGGCESSKKYSPSENQCCGCTSYDMKPDMVILGKALSGGVYPVSCVLSRNEVMNVLPSGSHGSTYGGNAIASAVGMAALEVLKEEKLVENSALMGELFRDNLSQLKSLDYVSDIRGRGLMNAIEVVPNATRSAWQICLALAKRGILCKPTHDHIIRLTPPLTINKDQINKASDIIVDVFKNVHNLKDSDMIPDPQRHD